MPPASGPNHTSPHVEEVISGEANPAYAAFHRPRFMFLIEVLRSCGAKASSRILDIGASPLSSLIAAELGIRVESMGLESASEAKDFTHHQFDLNALQDRTQWRTDFGPYDIIVFAEVLEHLYTAPELVLPYLRELLVTGGVLLLQTPNAVAFRKRAKMVLGVNPFERIRTERDNPGKVAVLVVTSDRGLAGAYSSSAIRTAEQLVARLRDEGNESVKVRKRTEPKKTS